jgi:hypothetical protein
MASDTKLSSQPGRQSHHDLRDSRQCNLHHEWPQASIKKRHNGNVASRSVFSVTRALQLSEPLMRFAAHA